MKIQYKEALAEVNTILESTEEEIKNKIPKEFIKFVKENMDERHIVNLQLNKKLKEQKLLKETRIILALIYRDYLCTPEERKELLKQEQKEKEKIQKEKQEKYNIKFEQIKQKKEEKKIIEKIETSKETAIIEVPEEKWYKKIINKILKILRIK